MATALHSSSQPQNKGEITFTLCPSLGLLQLELQQVPSPGGRILFLSQEGSGLT